VTTVDAVVAAASGVVRFANPWWLVLLPLALLPWWRASGVRGVHPWTRLLPPDPLSRIIDLGCRTLATMVMASLVLALAGLARVGQPVERISTGAEIAILLDRSRSMDEDLVGPAGPAAWLGDPPRRKKSEVARQLLGELVAARTHDRFAMMLFSTVPILVSDFSHSHAVVRAGVDVSASGRGLSETNIGAALAAALRLFADRPYIGPRVILLVSDGGARLAPETREQLTRAIRRERVAIYWIYLRSRRSPGLLADRELTTDQQDAVPEHFLHRFLQSTGMPYRAYEAESRDAMARAIEDIKRVEDRPLRYSASPPDSPLERPLLVAAFALLAMLAATVSVGTLSQRTSNRPRP
jgi:mxaC protein